MKPAAKEDNEELGACPACGGRLRRISITTYGLALKGIDVGSG